MKQPFMLKHGKRGIQAAFMTVLAAGLLLAVSGSTALAAYDHSVKEAEFEAPPACGQVNDLAVDEANEWIYAVCEGSGFGSRTIWRFDFNGDPASFQHVAPYLEENVIRESPSNASGSLGFPKIAVDNSGANPGFLYVAAGQNTSGGSEEVDVFKPSGEWAIGIPSTTGPFPGTKGDVDIGHNGFIYTVESASFHAIIQKYNPGTFGEVERVYTLLEGTSIAVDSTGAAWERIQTFGGTSIDKVSKWEADAFTTNLGVNWGSSEADFKKVQASPSPYFPDPLLSGGTPDLDVNLTRNDLYVNRGNRIEVYSQGTPEEPAFMNAPAFGNGTLSSSRAVVVMDDHRVFATSGQRKVVRFGAGNILPDVKTHPAQIDDIGHEEVRVSGEIKLAGGSDITDCVLEYGLTTSYGQEAPCDPDPSVTSFTTDTPVTSEMTGLEIGRNYHYRFTASNSEGTNSGPDRAVRPAAVLKVQTKTPTGVTTEGATLRGSLDPDGMPTTYYFQYGVGTSYGQTTPVTSAGSGSGVIDVSFPVSGLTPGKVWHYRLVAENELGTTAGADLTFRTASAPELSGVRASEVTATSAKLHATINPIGYDAEYRFEYGSTSGYGSSVPIPDGQIPAGTSPVEVEQVITGLQAGVTYHFRVVASNEWGQVMSPDTTFDFAPPTCPNDHVRQQTQSSYLPDCRAYELVSPGNVGAILLQPGAQMWAQGASQQANGYRASWSQNTGFATSPPRFTWFGAMGSPTGLNAKINDSIEMFASTRTTTGWRTTLPSAAGDELLHGGRHECSATIHLCLEHNEGFFGAEPQHQAVRVYTAEGRPVDEWPTNVAAIPNGRTFNGSTRASGDFSHFIFGSDDVVFAPGGQTGEIGTAYDNDIATRTVHIISKKPDGSLIEADGPMPEPCFECGIQRFEFPGVSTNGTHILMRTPSSEGQFRLHMRVNNSVSYEISRGRGVKPVDMTSDGSTVYFIAAQQLTPDDTDLSDDLYMWTEAGDTLTRISKGNGQGNSDVCSSSVAAGCGVGEIDTERDHPFELPSLEGLDDTVASQSGDVYFYSPEVLDASDPGVKDQRNLYVFRNGNVELVSTLDPGTEINRMQISPDGAFAAVLTGSKMTPYDNAGFRQMYTYNAATGEILCASCNPNGLPPEADVEASENGPFMSNDGRAFFTTKDSLVPRDTNGKIIDVYEYVGGRPQLITSGVGSRDNTGGSNTSGLFLDAVNTGLEAVSRDGTDVFFSTYETLVVEDENGEFVKFYNARVNGGFPSNPDLGPCAAADECHGPASQPAAPPVIASGANLGTAGNHAKPRKAKKKARKKARKRRSRRHSRKRGSKSRKARAKQRGGAGRNG